VGRWEREDVWGSGGGIDTLPDESGSCSGERAYAMTASIAFASGLKALPKPTGRFIHHQARFRSKATTTRCTRMAPRSTMRSSVFRLPTGTAYRGTPHLRLRWQDASLRAPSRTQGQATGRRRGPCIPPGSSQAMHGLSALRLLRLQAGDADPLPLNCFRLRDQCVTVRG